MSAGIMNFTLNLDYLNIRSLRNKIEELEMLMTKLGRPHVVLLTETWLYENETNNMSLNGYEAIHQ